MDSTLQYRFIEKNNEGVWLGLSFSSTYPKGKYIATMIFHRNRSIVEAYLSGNQLIIDRFNLLVTGSSSPNNLRWALSQVELFLNSMPPTTAVSFDVPNERLCKIYKYWLPKKFQVEYINNSFTITNRQSKSSHEEQHDLAE